MPALARSRIGFDSSQAHRLPREYGGSFGGRTRGEGLGIERDSRASGGFDGNDRDRAPVLLSFGYPSDRMEEYRRFVEDLRFSREQMRVLGGESTWSLDRLR